MNKHPQVIYIASQMSVSTPIFSLFRKCMYALTKTVDFFLLWLFVSKILSKNNAQYAVFAKDNASGTIKTGQNLRCGGCKVAAVKVSINIFFTIAVIFVHIFRIRPKNFAYRQAATYRIALLRNALDCFLYYLQCGVISAERIGLLQRCVNSTPHPVLKSLHSG